MQLLTWNGAGEGTTSDPFILTPSEGFIATQPFNILLKNNYLGSPLKHAYFKLSNQVNLYLLAVSLFDRDQKLIAYEPNYAINFTAMLTELVDYVDGPFIFNQSQGLYYLTKQQIFDIKNKLAGVYTGLWEAGRLYATNDMALYKTYLYVAKLAHHNTVFDPSQWERVTAKMEIITSLTPPASLGANLWIKPLLMKEEGGYVIVLEDSDQTPEVPIIEEYVEDFELPIMVEE